MVHFDDGVLYHQYGGCLSASCGHGSLDFVGRF